KDVRVSSRLTASPSCLVADEHDMGGNLARILKAVGQKGPQPKPILEINPAHPMVQRLNAEKTRFADWGNLLFDQALLAEGGQLVLGLVEPQSSGLGGGAFLLHYAARDAKLEAYDGRETAPASAKPGRFLGADGRPLDWPDAVVSGKSVGVPGLLRLFELAHRRHGKLPWASLFEPAIELAQK